MKYSKDLSFATIRNETLDSNIKTEVRMDLFKMGAITLYRVHCNAAKPGKLIRAGGGLDLIVGLSVDVDNLFLWLYVLFPLLWRRDKFDKGDFVRYMRQTLLDQESKVKPGYWSIGDETPVWRLKCHLFHSILSFQFCFFAKLCIPAFYYHIRVFVLSMEMAPYSLNHMV